MSDMLQLVANLHNLTSIYTKTLAWRPEQLEVRDGKARQAEAYRTFYSRFSFTTVSTWCV